MDVALAPSDAQARAPSPAVPAPAVTSPTRAPLLGAASDKANTLSSSSPTPSTAASWIRPVAYGLTNLLSVVLIVVANKMVMYTHKFSFAVALTWLHCLFTALGMVAMAAAGIFEVKRLPLARSLPVACCYVGFIVFNNLSIKLNTVGGSVTGAPMHGLAQRKAIAPAAAVSGCCVQ